MWPVGEDGGETIKPFNLQWWWSTLPSARNETTMRILFWRGYLIFLIVTGLAGAVTVFLSGNPVMSYIASVVTGAWLWEQNCRSLVRASSAAT